jgi:hypothetical protein
MLPSTRWCSTPVGSADPYLTEGDSEPIRLLQQHILSLGTKHEGNLAAQARAVLRGAILAGHAGEEQIASLLSPHKRTMHRRLVAEGTQFRALDAECRYDIARHLLEHSRLTIT